ncbi:hypothetical protein L1S32_08320 [Methanogenium sp. S4BF]|uniref:hypothetical protein n=1 Tax=Methanogenium sp. S4BF TaxID=1789226 RepID=UPI0024163ED9|nr:hypothetical protein [Methanogenium sp. S4BF]WFN33846.1 hypothetical protein L1S32_08320 [Methanogenium sp. S4BF]
MRSNVFGVRNIPETRFGGPADRGVGDGETADGVTPLRSDSRPFIRSTGGKSR